MTLGEFCRKRFAPWSESSSSLKTWRDFYRVGLMAIQAYSPLANLTLDAITTERIADFASHRQTEGMKLRRSMLPFASFAAFFVWHRNGENLRRCPRSKYFPENRTESE